MLMCDCDFYAVLGASGFLYTWLFMAGCMTLQFRDGNPCVVVTTVQNTLITPLLYVTSTIYVTQLIHV